MNLPLDGLMVLDFTQFLAGPVASLRLADLGAKVIKIEHHERGDLCRSLYSPALDVHEYSAFFQAINRNKFSLGLDLKSEGDKALIEALIKEADVMLHNFRPGVMQRLGLDYDAIKAINSSLIYGEISGYGDEGPWQSWPGQDLLLQAVSGLTALSGASQDGPVPMGLAIADYLAGSQLAQGILAALYLDEGGLVQVSMLEAILDFQFEPFTLYLNDGELPDRGHTNAAHALVGAPYGVYKTADGYMTLAMGSLPKIAELIGCPSLAVFSGAGEAFARRDEIKKILAEHLGTKATSHWLAKLEPADIWCAEVLNWRGLMQQEAFKVLEMTQTVVGAKGKHYATTRCPIRIDEKLLVSSLGAPELDQHRAEIEASLKEALSRAD